MYNVHNICNISFSLHNGPFVAVKSGSLNSNKLRGELEIPHCVNCYQSSIVKKKEFLAVKKQHWMSKSKCVTSD